MKKISQLRHGGGIFCRLCLWVCLLVSASTLSAQDISSKKVTLKFKEAPIINVLLDIQKQTNISFAYEKSQLEQLKPVTIDVKDMPLEDALKKVLEGTGYTYKIAGNTIAIVKQTEPKTVELVEVSGRVVDEKGDPIPGASVIVYGTQQGVATDIDGRYILQMQPDGVLQVSFVGYKTETIPVKGKTRVNVTLNPTSENIEEVQVVAFGTQKKESVVSAITTIRPMDLKSSRSDLTIQFAGKIAGMIGWQTGGYPAALTEEEMNTKFYIRGITSFQENANYDPLILIDRVESSKLDLSRLAPEDIESFSVLKDASATAMYGARGANGVILVTTKKGEEGSVYTSVRYEAILSQPTKKIDVVDPITYMRMYNEALLTRSSLASPKYSVERIERTQSGEYPSWVYPANDWYKIMFKDYNVNHHLGVNIRGGSNIVQYYAALNYNRDMGMFKTDPLNDFDCNIVNNQTSARVNLTINLNAGIQLLVNASATLDKFHGPLAGMTDAYYYAFNASPADFAPTYPGDKQYAWPHLRFGGVTQETLNPYKELQKGYMERTRYSTINRVEYIQNLSTLVKGLELRASISMTQSGYYTTGFSTEPYMYALGGYDFETGEHTLQALNPTGGRRTLEVSENTSSTETSVTYEVQALHTAAWKDHQTSVIGVFQAQEQTYTPIASVLEGMPRRNVTFSGRASYGYKDRYFIEGSFGYNASERFAKKNRWGFFPAVGGSWVVSKEPWMQSISNVLNFMKFRVSWGKVGNDGVITSPRFVFLPNIITTEALGLQADKDPQPGSSLFYRYAVQSYVNENIKWEIAEQVNFGLEAQLFDNTVEFTLDAYQEIRHNILSTRTTVPASMGIEIDQLANVGSTRSRGIDFSGKIQHAFSPDVWFILNGTLTYNKVVYREIEEASFKPEWQRMVGQEISQQIGYIAEGLFRNEAEIANSPTQSGDVMPGDIRYRDLNADGVIDVEDATYIGFPTTLRLIYGFNGYVNYKNWEFNFAFQGSGKRSFFMDPEAISPFAGDHAMLTAIYEDHWSEDNMKSRPFWPRLSTYNLIHHNPEEDWVNEENAEERRSTYFMRECRFLRCTALELAYNMPEKLIRRFRLQNMKFFARVNNPFLISNFDVWDVELGESGFNYPIQRTYTIGLNFNF